MTFAVHPSRLSHHNLATINIPLRATLLSRGQQQLGLLCVKWPWSSIELG